MPDLDIEALRATTPGCANRNHLHNAGAALLNNVTITAIADYLQREAMVGGYEAEITPLERKDGRVTLQVEIAREGKDKEDKDKEKGRRGKDGVNTKVTINSGQFQPYMFAYPGEASDKLIVAVSAK